MDFGGLNLIRERKSDGERSSLRLNRALESFIRAKYEKRKWIAKEWIPPEMTVPIDVSVVLSASHCCLAGK